MAKQTSSNRRESAEQPVFESPATAESDLENLLRTVDIEALFLDSEGRIRRFTPGMRRVLTLTQSDLGRPLEHFAEELGSGVLEDLKRVTASGSASQRELRGASGGWVSLRIRPYVAESRRRGAVIAIADATPLKNAAEMTRITSDQLKHATAELGRQREELEELASIMAHDLKRPVVAMNGLLTVLQESAGEEDQAAHAELIARSLAECARMRRILEALSLLSATTRREFAVEEVELESLLDSLIERFRPLAEERGVHLCCSCSVGRVRLPRGALEEACVNLLENAFKYGCTDPNPRIDVSCQLNRGVIELSVRDNGKGIAPEHHQRVFEPFRRLDPEHSDGSGLGLVAARRMIGKYGGSVILESEVGRGAEFVVRLPVEADRAPGERTLPRRVLLVEDDTLDAKAVERQLGRDFSIVRVVRLSDAIDRLSGDTYDLVILDLSLPDGHGLELVRHMRTVLHSNTPVVVVTGHGDGIIASAITGTVSGFVEKSDLHSDVLRSEVAKAMGVASIARIEPRGRGA